MYNKGLEQVLQHNGGDNWEDKHEGGQHRVSTRVDRCFIFAESARVAEVCLAAGISFCTLSVTYATPEWVAKHICGFLIK